jgi:hypothetical protein
MHIVTPGVFESLHHPDIAREVSGGHPVKDGEELLAELAAKIRDERDSMHRSVRSSP